MDSLTSEFPLGSSGAEIMRGSADPYGSGSADQLQKSSQPLGCFSELWLFPRPRFPLPKMIVLSLY